MKLKFQNYLAWLTAALLALSFIFAGYSKIPPGSGMVKRFEAWGYGADFALLIGILELSAGLLVLVPKLAAFGAFSIMVLMIGAIYTHLQSGIGSPLFAFIYLLLALILFVLRYKQAWLLNSLHRS